MTDETADRTNTSGDDTATVRTGNNPISENSGNVDSLAVCDPSDGGNTIAFPSIIPPAKNAVSKNALKHGCYAKDRAVLPWESQEEYVELAKGIREEFNPEGMAQEDEVATIISLKWLRRRLERQFRLRFVCDPLAEDLTRAAGNGEGVEAYLRDQVAKVFDVPAGQPTLTLSPAQLSQQLKIKAARKALEEALQSLKGVQSADVADQAQHNQQLDQAMDALKELVERAEAESGGSFAQAGLDKAREHDQKSIQASDAILERVFRLNEQDAFLKRLGSLDARIEKGYQRLCFLKQFKLNHGKASA